MFHSVREMGSYDRILLLSVLSKIAVHERIRRISTFDPHCSYVCQRHFSINSYVPVDKFPFLRFYEFQCIGRFSINFDVWERTCHRNPAGRRRGAGIAAILTNSKYTERRLLVDRSVCACTVFQFAIQGSRQRKRVSAVRNEYRQVVL